MERAEVLAALGNLSGSEAKLLLHRMASGGGKSTNAEIMRVCQIRDRKTYFAGKRKLERLGWWENPTFAGRESLPPGREILPVIGREILPGREIQPPTGREILPESPDWLARFSEVDRMPGADATDKAHDKDFLARRTAQVSVLQEAWRDFFGPEELTIVNARRLLSLAGDYAEDLLEPMEYVQGRMKAGKWDSTKGTAFSYIKAMLERKRREQPTPQGPRSLSNAPVHNSERGGNDSEQDNYWLTKPSERTAKVLAKLKAAGRLVPEEDD